MGNIFTIFNNFLIVILIPGTQQITLSIKDVIKNLQYILRRNRERKCAADIFYVEANVWLLLETFHFFFKQRAAASKKILKNPDCFWNLLKEKNVQLLLKDVKKKCAS